MTMALELGNSGNEVVALPGGLRFAQPRAISTVARQRLQEGLSHLQLGEGEEAVQCFSQSLECAPQFTEAHIFLGIAHALTHNIYPALDHLETATQLEPDSFAAHYTLAQLNFKLRIPIKGYEEAELARRCPMTLEQRKMLTDLLREERARERNGIMRPWFNKPFKWPMLVLGGGVLATFILMVLTHLH
jgi:tetratricopeptide (TPR) repeat protein